MKINKLGILLWFFFGGCASGLYQELLDKAAPPYELRLFVYSNSNSPLANYRLEVKHKNGSFYNEIIDLNGLAIFRTEAGKSELMVWDMGNALLEKGSLTISPHSTKYQEDVPKVQISHGPKVVFQLAKVSAIIPQNESFTTNIVLPELTIRASGLKTEYPFVLTAGGGKTPYQFRLVSETISTSGLFPVLDRLRNLLQMEGNLANLPGSILNSDGNYFLGSVTILAKDAEDSWSTLNLPVKLHFKYVFVLDRLTQGDMNGLDYPTCQGLSSLAKADCACQERAKMAGLKYPEKFVAYLSTTTHSARCRLAGLGPGCTAQNFQGGPWYHPWGYTGGNFERRPVFGDLGLDEPTNPITFSLDGANMGSSFVWTGSNQLGQFTGFSCSDWTSSSDLAQADAGYANGSFYQWAISTMPSCNSYGYLYCFEKD